MKKLVLLIAAIVMTAAFFLSAAYAENHTLTRQEASALMDAFESLEFEEAWEWKAFQKENARRTREWETKYGPHGRWQGDVLAAYVLAYGTMPTYDAPYADPLAVLPGTDNLTESAARTLAMEAVEKVEERLPRAMLENMESTWSFYYSRALDWFWEPSGTWVFCWYSKEGKLVCMAYVSDCEAIMIYQLTPDETLRDHLFMPMEQLQAQGLSVERQNYEPLYAMTVPIVETSREKLLEGTFHMFNMNRPDDFKGHSMSVSDIIALKLNGEVSFHYVDSFGFKKLDGFLPDNPLKNAEMTVEDDYGMIDGIINNGKNPALEPPRQEEQQPAPEPSAQTEELQKQKFPSILERLNSPQPARAAPKKDSPKKRIGMEL